jgi:hypothetical protein
MLPEKTTNPPLVLFWLGANRSVVVAFGHNPEAGAGAQPSPEAMGQFRWNRVIALAVDHQ